VTDAGLPCVVGLEDFDGPDAQQLRAEQRREIDAAEGGDTEPGDAPTAESVPVFLVARDAAGRAIGCGGLRVLDDGVVEVKRMYVRPAARGTGVAPALLRALELQARGLGATRLLLETGTQQHRAIRFYEREGYLPVPAFGPYVGAAGSRCFGVAL
jgi:putative acetyltransferase